jgi:hypothetical protein
MKQRIGLTCIMLIIGALFATVRADDATPIATVERAGGALQESPGSGADTGGMLEPIGPDVIVGDLYDLERWGSVGDITAFSVGTISCNAGDEWINWYSDTNQHPVIAQNMYRLKDGRFEQIGMSWLKHGFFALSGSFCYGDCQGDGSGNHLGPHCSDAYSAGLNGSQSRLGPRSQVNPATGYFPYPFSAPSPDPTIGRRLQVHNADLDPALNPGASYFVEGHYIAADDAASDNDLNNASYRQIDVTGGGSFFDIEFTPGLSTVQKVPAIYAWQATDAGVAIAKADVPDDGLLLLASRVTDLGGGQHHYEYALYNMNSDRAAQAFAVPIPAGTNVTNIEFHDVDYHSGEPFSPVDWAAAIEAGSLIWQCETQAQNPDANALRWATLYNFGFDADRPAVRTKALIGLFKPGSPGFVAASTSAPSGCPGDVDGDSFRNVTDFTHLAGAYGSAFGDAAYDANADMDGDGFINVTDFTQFAAVYGVPCP